MKILPPECITLFSAISTYISGSAKREHVWVVVQQKCLLQPLKALKNTPIRWLSCYNSVKRHLRRRKTAIIFFQRECEEMMQNNTQPSQTEKTAANILQLLQDPLMTLYFLFLEAMLGRLTRANEYLQTEKAIVPELHNKMTEVYIDFLKMYMKEDYIAETSISDIDPTCESQFKDVNDIYIGQNTQNYLACGEVCENEDIISLKDEFLEMCRNFLIECCVGIKDRCKLSEDRHYFNPINALNPQFHNNHPNLNECFQSYSQIKACNDE